MIDRTALGFDQIKPPGLAEVQALRADGTPIAAADAQRNRSRKVTVGCGEGPVLAVAGRFVNTSVSTTVGALLDGGPLPARPCESAPLELPTGQQELLVSPGAAFIVDGVQLSGPLAERVGPAATADAPAQRWSADHRELTVPAAETERVLVVPESINPGWTARAPDGAQLTPVTVNGWQQGWVVPAGTSGTVTLSFASNALYRVGLAGGLALLPILAALALLPSRRRRDDPVRPWAPRPAPVIAALIAMGALISGVVGAVVFGAAAGLRYLLRARPRADRVLTLGGSSVALTLAGAALSRYPWRSVDGYIGHSPWVQLAALCALALLAASLPRFAQTPLSAEKVE